MKKFIGTILFTLCLASTEALEYTVYLESWDSQYVSAYQGVVNNSDSHYQTYDGMTVNLSFAAFAFTPAAGYPTNASGLYGTAFGGSYGGQDTLVNTITSFVHTNGGKVQLAFGGNSYAQPYAPNYFISQTPNWPNNIASLATGVASVINALNLDGVDFDIEDPQPSSSTAQEFADQLFDFLTQVRAALPNKTITLTIPAQAWGQYWQYLAQKIGSSTTNVVDAINFMEYDIWINTPTTNYVTQVEADILTYTSPVGSAPGPNYAQGWGIPASLIQIGIMPGNDDTGQTMTTTGSQELTRYAMQNNLPGVFIWDIDRDAMTVQTPTPFYPSTPYAFSNAIREAINTTEVGSVHYPTRATSKRFVNVTPNFIKQINPRQGQEPYEN